MTDEEEFSARSQLKWTREGDAWILLYHRRRMGRVVPDPAKPSMYRSLKSGDFSDISNLSWAKGLRAGSGHKGGRLRTCKRPPKMPSKTGGSPSEIAAHAFECSVAQGGWPSEQFTAQHGIRRR